MRIADLHAHYPMHVLSGDDPPRLRDAVTDKPTLRDRVRGAVMWLANRIANYRSLKAGPRVTAERLRAGGAGVVLSVLYEPFSEFDLDEPYGAPPEPGYPAALLEQLERVEADLAGREGIAVARTAADLDRALRAGDVAMVHAVEGGFHLGHTPEAVERTVAELARRGVAYVTLAHLFYRRVATNTPALPFLPDRLYDKLFPQDGPAVTELGAAAIRAMERHGVLVDVAHMRADALARTLELLEPDTPVLATHAGARLGKAPYMLDDATLREIARRDGLVGLILAQHQLNDGVRRTRTRSFKASFRVICRHLDHLHDVLGTHAHSAIGSDLDGFIKPVLAGLDRWDDLQRLAPALTERYGEHDAAAILHGNAERVIRRALSSRPSAGPAR